MENFGKYIDNFFIIVVGERWRFGNVGIIGLFCVLLMEKKLRMDSFINFRILNFFSISNM